MESIFSGNLSLILFFPLVGIPLVLLLSYVSKDPEKMKIGALVVAIIEFLLSIPLFTNFELGFAGMQFETKIPWLAGLGVSYHIGIDGISILLVMLTTFLMPITLLSSWHSIHKGMREFLILMLLLETALLGFYR